MQNKINLVADENIPKLEELLGKVANIHYLSGREIVSSDLAGMDALLVRSVTKVNESLLADTQLSFVGSCTIGTDHVDVDYLHNNGIAFASAPGCNAAAVVDYVLTAIFSICSDIEYWRKKTVGIIGLGAVGSRLQQRLSQMGIQGCAYDPFVDSAKHSLEQVLACDVVTLHVPLTLNGEHKTKHLIGKEQIQRLKPGSLLINTSRGAVVDNSALLDYLENNQLQVVLDVYEQEPTPEIELLDAITLATSHIAGYSLQGKIRGSMQVVDALYRHFLIDEPVPDLLSEFGKRLNVGSCKNISEMLALVYDIKADSTEFKKAYKLNTTAVDKAKAFDAYRKNYQERFEWSFIEFYRPNHFEDVSYMLGFRKK